MLVFCLRRIWLPIRMDPEVRILIYERTYNSYGVGFVVKDGHADVQIGAATS